MTLETRARRLRAKLPPYRSDNWKIINYLASGKELTVMQCVTIFGTPNLRSRISELEGYGWPVNREGEPCPHIKDRKGVIMDEWPEELRVQEFPEIS